MTVGIVAACRIEEYPTIVATADRMVTANRESPIEYEHPTTKLTDVGNLHESVNMLGVSSGSVSLIDELFYKLEQHLESVEEPINVRGVADLAASFYNNIIRETIQYQLLEPMGMELEDLKKQRKFQDDFIQSLMADVQEVRNTIISNLDVLLAGVGPQGAQIYEIQAGDVTGHNSIGYATVGSGANPAASEFMRTQYGAEDATLDETVSVSVAAKTRAEDAQGVGEEMNIAIVSNDGVDHADEETIDSLRSREKEIRKKQENVKGEILSADPVEWVNKYP